MTSKQKSRLKAGGSARRGQTRAPKLPSFPDTPKLGGKAGTKKGRRSHSQPSMKKDRYDRMNARQAIKKQAKQNAAANASFKGRTKK